MRKAFSDALVQFATQDSKVLLLTGDHGYALFDDFRKHCPTQYINAGIAEQNMVGMSAGLAQAGFRPFVYGLSAFIPIRVLEQIKLDVARDQLPVIFIGDGAGFVYSHLGISHQSTEDIACTRTIPNLAVLSPADAYEMNAAMKFAYESSQPTYIRMGKADKGSIHTEQPDLSRQSLVSVFKKQYSHCDSTSTCILATGSMVQTAIEICKSLDLNTEVWSIPKLKPINQQEVIDVLSNHTQIITMEEHNIYGGMGSLISEISTASIPRRVLRIGVEDRFSEKCGSYEYLLKEHGLDLASIMKKVRHFLRM